jgi:integrase/recombinase XerC
VKVPFLKLRGSVYWYQRRVPKALHHVLGSGVYAKSLNTKDLVEATKQAVVHTAFFEELLGMATPQQLYDAAVTALRSPLNSDEPDFDPYVSDLLGSVPENQREAVFHSLPPAAQAHFRAAQEVLLGRERPLEYTMSFRTVIQQYLDTRSELHKKTLARYWTAYESYLGQKADIPIVLVDRASVFSWLDRIRLEKGTSTKQAFVLNLKAVYAWAMDREIVSNENKNPFEGHKFKSDTVSYSLMADELLAEILDGLKPIDRLPAIIARYSGMRLSEVFESELVTEEGVLCFRIGATGTYKGAKTSAGNRLVPVRACIAEQVAVSKPQWSSFNAYGKRFGRAKAKIVGANRRELAFHSLRVSFITYAGRAGFSEQQVAWLVGHEEGKGRTMSGQLYFKGYNIKTMQEIVESVPEFIYGHHAES